MQGYSRGSWKLDTGKETGREWMRICCQDRGEERAVLLHQLEWTKLL